MNHFEEKTNILQNRAFRFCRIGNATLWRSSCDYKCKWSNNVIREVTFPLLENSFLDSINYLLSDILYKLYKKQICILQFSKIGLKAYLCCKNYFISYLVCGSLSKIALLNLIFILEFLMSYGMNLFYFIYA